MQIKMLPVSVEKPPASVGSLDTHWICWGETGQPERRKCFNMNNTAGPAT